MEHDGKQDSRTTFTECVDASDSTFGSVLEIQRSQSLKTLKLISLDLFLLNKGPKQTTYGAKLFWL